MSEQLTSIPVFCAFAIATLLLVVWLESLRRKDASIIDLAWGFGFVVVAWTAYAFTTDGPSSRLLLPILTSVWGLRLSGYLTWRNHGKPEDYRYQAMRRKWGDSFPIASLLTVFGVQGVVMWIVSLPVQVGIASHDPSEMSQSVGWLLPIGISLWALGLFFESIGDWQLARFKADPNNQGKVLDTGLWRYTRHPNYFGDAVVWWGLYLIAVSQSGAWWTIVGPIAMSIFLMRVSGVTLLEKSLRKTKPGYAAYIARTNAFFPGPPQRS